MFDLDTFVAQGITDANGVASTTLNLKGLKNGTYTLTTSYTTPVEDGGKWLSTGTTDTFKLQTK